MSAGNLDEGLRMRHVEARSSHDYDSMPVPGTLVIQENELNAATNSPSLLRFPIPSDDPNDPLNWPIWRKCLNFFFIVAFTAGIFTMLVLQTIVWMQLNIELGISYQHLNWSVAVQSVGLSVGCLMFIPFTKKYGRRSSYILSMAVLAGMYWWTARMQTTAELYVTNLIVGLASAMNETLAQMTIADIFFIHQRGRANAWYMTAVSIGNLLPIAGGAQAEAEGWRATYYTAAGCFTGVTVIALFLFEETKYIPIVSGVSDPDDTTASPSGDLDKGPKAIAMQEVDDMPDPELQKPHLAAPPAMNSWRQRLRWTTTTDDSLWQHFMAPFATSGLPAVMWASLQYASVVAWITVIASLAAQFFPAPPYNFGSLALGAMSVPTFLGSTIGSFISGISGDYLIAYLSRRNGGVYEPEYRLWPVVLTIPLMPGGLAMFGATLDRQMHWILPAVGTAISAAGMGIIGDAAFTYCIDCYRELTGQAFVMVAFWRNALSIAIPFTLQPWLRMGLTNMMVFIAMLEFACTCTTVPVLIWGKKMRAWSRSFKVVQGASERAM